MEGTHAILGPARFAPTIVMRLAGVGYCSAVVPGFTWRRGDCPIQRRAEVLSAWAVEKLLVVAYTGKEECPSEPRVTGHGCFFEYGFPQASEAVLRGRHSSFPLNRDIFDSYIPAHANRHFAWHWAPTVDMHLRKSWRHGAPTEPPNRTNFRRIHLPINQTETHTDAPFDRPKERPTNRQTGQRAYRTNDRRKDGPIERMKSRRTVRPIEACIDGRKPDRQADRLAGRWHIGTV